MSYKYKSVQLATPAEESWKEVALKADASSIVGSLKADFLTFKKKRKQIKKRQISNLKLSQSTSRSSLAGLKQEERLLKSELRHEGKKIKKSADTMSTSAYIKQNLSKLENWKNENLELISHKYGKPAKNEKYLLAVALIQEEYKKKAKVISDYKAADQEIETDRKQKLQELLQRINEEIAQLKIKEQAEKEEIRKNRNQIKENIASFKRKHKEATSKRRKETRLQISVAKKNATEAKKQIKASNIFLNAYYEPVQEEKSAKKGELLQRAFQTCKNTPRAMWMNVQKALIGFASDDKKIIFQEKYVSYLDKRNKELQKRPGVDFEWKAKQITLDFQLEHQEKILEVLRMQKAMLDEDKKNFTSLKSSYDKVSQKAKASGIKDAVKKDIKGKKEALLLAFKIGEITNENKRTSLKALKKEMKTRISALRFENEMTVAKEKLRFDGLDTKMLIQKERELMNSLIEDALKTIPTASWKNQRWICGIASFLLPGLGQLINKQYAKGILLLCLAGLVYGVLLPLAAGWISFRGEGVIGLGEISPVTSGAGSVFTTYADARYRLIEGIIGVVAIAFGLLALVMSARDAWWYGRARELGIRPGNWRSLKRFFTNSGLPYLMSIPALIGVLFTVFLPLAATLLLAFTNYSRGHIPPGNKLEWVNFDNFKEVFSGSYAASFGYVASWTVIWTVSVSVGVVAVGTFLAFIADQKRIKPKIFWKTTFILPWAVPAFATILFFSAAFGGAGSGIYNQLFGSGLDFKQDQSASRAILILMQIWLGHSYIFLLITGVKKSIPEDLYEASSMEGASKARQFATISAPLIMAQIAPLMIGQVVFNFNNYGVIFLFNDGGPQGLGTYAGGPGSTDIFISLIFKMTTSGGDNQVALASAFTIVISFFIVLVSAAGFVRSKAFKGVS